MTTSRRLPHGCFWGLPVDFGLDLCAKELLQTYSLVQFVMLRSIIAIAIMLAIAPRFGGLKSLRTHEAGWHAIRSVLAIGAMFGFFYGLARMPLVNALTLGYTAPLIVTALSAIFLGDEVGWRRWTGGGHRLCGRARDVAAWPR